MENDITADSPLDYVTFQILPEKRYDACVCLDEKEEIVGHGPLELLMEHIPTMKDQLAEVSCDSLRLELPDTIDQRTWFTKATLKRFLHIIGSLDLLNKSIAVSNEMSQLDEARKFHLSLYKQGEDGNKSSDNSKNELLRALDSRLAALNEELVSSFNLAVGATLSLQEMMDLHKFCQHFGGVNIRDLLSKLSETCQNRQTFVPDKKKSPIPFVSKDDYANKTAGNIKMSGSSNSEKPIKYNASPAKAAEIERQNLTDSEESSFSSEDDQPPVERSRTLIRSATPRRSASPMRRIQVGRSGSRRTPALTIKSLSFPARERISSNRETRNNDSDSEESEEQNKKTEVNVTRISVQDAISLFESKQKDQTVDAQKKKPSVENPTNTNKAVLRRWSSGMGESQRSLSPNMPEHTASEDTSNLADEDAPKSGEVKPEYEERLTVDMEIEKSAKTALNLSEDDAPVSRGEKSGEKLDSAEWSRQKEAELSQMLVRFAEFNQISQNKNAEPDNSKTRKSRLEQKGALNGRHKERREEKPKWDNSKKRVDKEVKPKQKVLDKPKAEKTSVKTPTSRIPSINKNMPLSSNSKRESPKPAAPKKAPSRSSPVPAVRKSWPLTPSPRATGTTPTKIKTETPSGITAIQPKIKSPAPRQKPQLPASVSRPSPRLERSELQQKDVKKPQVDAKKSLKKADESKNGVGPKGGKTTKTKSAVGAQEDVGKSQAKAVVRKKVTKKSSVVPLEAKPSTTRKVSGNSPACDPTVHKINTPNEVKEPISMCEVPVNNQENVGASISEIVHPEEENPVSETPNGHLELEKETEKELENPKDGSEIELSVEAMNQDYELAERMSESKAESEIVQEPVISPAAWEESSHQDPIPSGNCSAPSPPNHDVAASCGPRVRHSLSQMLLEETSEPDIIEWGNAENPPTMVYQKDAPKGFKRLLKFARKNKGEANGASWASPYTSEGEDDGDEYKSLGKRNSDSLLKVALHSKNYAEGFLSDSEPLSARSNASNSSARSSSKFQDGHTTSKGSRSFFSLSAFRGNKS